MADNTDHFGPGQTFSDSETFADGILARPLLTRERGVHHYRRRRFSGIAGAKVTAGGDSNAHCLEVARRDYLISCARLLPGRGLRPVLAGTVRLAIVVIGGSLAVSLQGVFIVIAAAMFAFGGR